jgi:hypothetical protein
MPGRQASARRLACGVRESADTASRAQITRSRAPRPHRPCDRGGQDGQKHDYPARQHRISYARRTGSERTFSTIKDPATTSIARGWCRLTGLTPLSAGAGDGARQRQSRNRSRMAVGAVLVPVRARSPHRLSEALVQHRGGGLAAVARPSRRGRARPGQQPASRQRCALRRNRRQPPQECPGRR